MQSHGIIREIVYGILNTFAKVSFGWNGAWNISTLSGEYSFHSNVDHLCLAGVEKYRFLVYQFSLVEGLDKCLQILSNVFFLLG